MRKSKLQKFIIIFLFLIIIAQNCLYFNNISYAVSEASTKENIELEEVLESEKEALGISNFLKEAESYTKEAFPDLDINKLMTSSIKGDIDLSFIKKAFLKLIGNELAVAIKLMVSVLVIIIINSICKAIIENLGNEETAKIVYFLQYMAIITIVLTSFKEILFLTRETILKIVSFMNLLVPLFTTLILTTGSFSSANVIQPILLFFINFVGNFCNNFLIPLILILISLTVISNISDKVQIASITKFFKSSIVWILGIVLTIFTCLLSLEGTLSSSVDGLTSKTAKAVVANFIPVVGKIMGDTVETVIGCSNILKNTVGIIGVVIIIGIVLLPMIKLMVYAICFKFTSALGETIAESKIVKLISGLADTYKILLAILFSVSVMFIVGITLVLKITNSSIMYR